MRPNWLFRALVAVAALASCLLGLQVALGTAASAASAPAVTSVSPSSGPTAGGTSVVISGTGFTGATEVDFGTGASVPFTVVSDGEITTTSPPGSSLVSIRVITPAGESALSFHDVFTYANAPTITELFPSTGPTAGGTAVSITGSGFTGATSVTFGGVAASNVTVVSNTQLTVTAPPGSAWPGDRHGHFAARHRQHHCRQPVHLRRHSGGHRDFPQLRAERRRYVCHHHRLQPHRGDRGIVRDGRRLQRHRGK